MFSGGCSRGCDYPCCHLCSRCQRGGRLSYRGKRSTDTDDQEENTTALIDNFLVNSTDTDDEDENTEALLDIYLANYTEVED